MNAIIKSFLAGCSIGIGGMVYLNTPYPINAFMFAIGLYLICTLGLTLYTGKIGYLDKSNMKQYPPMLFFNLLGAGLMGFILRYFSDFDVGKIVEKRMGQTVPEILFLSIICGVLMYLAVYGYSRTKSPFSIVFPVSVFILAGTEHCIANIFFFMYHGMNNFLWMHTAIVIMGNAIGSIMMKKVTEEA